MGRAPEPAPAVVERRLAIDDSTLAVIVPTLDEALALPRLLERIAPAPGAQARDRADLVIVADGGSRDATGAIAARLGATVADAPRGRGTQLAAGARLAACDVLLFLHADSLPAPGALARVRAAFADPACEATAMRQRIEARGVFYRCVERSADFRSRRGWVWGDSGLAVRRRLYEAVGGFADLAVFEDVDLSRRLRARTRVRWLADAELCVSPRRWQKEGALRCTLRNWMLSGAFFLGVDPRRLARHYMPHAKAQH
jgi:rSAM/selenodomain-associated transferase 2